jgi:hypothetical protein
MISIVRCPDCGTWITSGVLGCGLDRTAADLCTWCSLPIEPGLVTLRRADGSGHVHRFHARCWEEHCEWLRGIAAYRPWRVEVDR